MSDKSDELRPKEMMFLRRVVQGEDPNKVAKSLGYPSVLKVRRVVYAEAMDRLARLAVHTKILSLKWRSMFEKAKKTLAEIMDDKEATSSARVNACKAVLDTLAKVSPGVLRETEVEMSLDEAAEAAVSGGVDAAPSVGGDAVN